MEPKSCPHCGSVEITYSVTSSKYKVPRVAGVPAHVITKHWHFYSCKCGANMKGRDQFDALRKWNNRFDKTKEEKEDE